MTEKNTETPIAESAEATVALENIWKLNGKFPVLVDYLVFFGIFLLAQAAGMLAALLCGFKIPSPELLASLDETVRHTEELNMGNFNAINYVVAMSVTLAGFLYYRRRRRGPKIIARFSLRGFNPVVLVWGVVFMLSTSVVLEPLLNLLPAVPNAYGRGVWAALTIVGMAPLFEEVLFRGILLESTRARYGVMTAWLVSSAMFGVVHVHPTVAVNAFVLGLVFAFIYMQTNSLWATIILHAVNNGIAYLVLMSGNQHSMLIDMVGSRTFYVLIYIGALAVFAVSGYMMVMAMRRLKAADKNNATA